MTQLLGEEPSPGSVVSPCEAGTKMAPAAKTAAFSQKHRQVRQRIDIRTPIRGIILMLFPFIT
jgi:hypothetical protein